MRKFAMIWLLAACGSVSNPSKTQPSIKSLTPDHGSVEGGTMVTVTGSHFGSGNAIVLVGGVEAMSATIVSDSSVAFMAPAGAQEGAIVDVVVSTDSGYATADQAFTYNYRPVILAISPSVGKIAGGTAVTITGRGFMDSGTPVVTIAGGQATNVVVVDDKTLTATTAAPSAGTPAFVPEDVQIRTDNGGNVLQAGYSFAKQGLMAIGPSSRCCQPDVVVYVDPTNGAVQKISTAAIHAHGCALSPSGQVYVVGNASGGASNTRALYILDPLTGNASAVGTLLDAASANRNLGSLAFNGNNLFGIDTGSRTATPTRQIAAVNVTTGQLALQGAPMTVNYHHGVAAKDANTMYVADSSTGSLDTVALATGVRTTGLAFAGGNGDTIHGMVNGGTGAFYIATNMSRTIYSVTLGGSATLAVVATIPTTTLSAIGGLCQTPPSF
jgi:hypothetical protein